MKHIREFSRFAQSYQKYKVIQSKVASHLVKNVSSQGRYILDLGAGSGEVFKNIDWKYEQFYALDASERMLRLHPPCDRKILCNFDDVGCLERLKSLEIDQIFASSSLQWSGDLERTLFYISQMSSNVAFAVFTSGTFHTIHRLASLSSPIRDKWSVIKAIEKFFCVQYETREYKLFFNDKMQLFRYIKRSGVSQGKRRLGYKEMKDLIEQYPYNYLEFEVVFAWSKF